MDALDRNSEVEWAGTGVSCHSLFLGYTYDAGITNSCHCQLPNGRRDDSVMLSILSRANNSYLCGTPSFSGFQGRGSVLFIIRG